MNVKIWISDTKKMKTEVMQAHIAVQARRTEFLTSSDDFLDGIEEILFCRHLAPGSNCKHSCLQVVKKKKEEKNRLSDLGT